jgi:ABC-type Zn uptake system ZnuABC Zn-binding protein ZnuA
MKRRSLAALAAFAAVISLSACSSSEPAGTQARENGTPSIVATSAIVADFATRIAGEAAQVSTLIPNGYDSHTYEPKPSELSLLGDAELIVLADAELNAGITGLVRLSGDQDRVLDLNAAALTSTELIYRESGNDASANPHTWTSPVLAAKWVTPLTDRIVALAPAAEAQIRANAEKLVNELAALDAEIVAAIASIAPADRKLVVYHDAWVYFGQQYGLEVVGALQAASFAEPSAAELGRMVAQIRDEGVKVFFGSEVFPSDVLEVLEAESGARYESDLADDRLPGNPGDANHSYLALMRANLDLLVNGLSA